MKLLIKRILRSKFSIKLRNSLKIKPEPINLRNISNASVSDAFAWRTDNNYVTKFKFTDILRLFYKIDNSQIAFHFYTKDFNLIKKIKLNNIDLSNEILIDEKLLGGIKDYGTFYIYHSTKKMNTEKNIISNRCYIGYSKNNNLFSYVHGNTLVNYKKFTNEDLISENIINTSLFSNQSYRIQKFFNNFDKNELFFSNPTSKQITIYINQKRISLKKGCCILVNTYGDKIVQFRSNCLFLRPTIFSYKDEYIDVHHA